MSRAFNQAAANDNPPDPNREYLRACEGGDLAKVKHWLKKGANIDARHTNNDTGLIIALRESHEEIAVFLLAKKGRRADIGLQNNQGESALHAAVKHCAAQVERLVLLMGPALLNLRDEDGATAAFHAAQRGRDEALELLGLAGADLSLPDNNKTTPLMQATKFNQTKAAGALLGNPAGLDAQDQHGMTALMHAAGMGSNIMTQAYVISGAKPDLKNEDGKTAADIALAKGRRDLFDVLEQALEKLNAERFGAYHTGTKDAVAAMKPLSLRMPGVKT